MVVLETEIKKKKKQQGKRCNTEGRTGKKKPLGEIKLNLKSLYLGEIKPS